MTEVKKDRAPERVLDGREMADAVPLLRELLGLSLELSSAGTFDLPAEQLVSRLPRLGLDDLAARAALHAASCLGLVRPCLDASRFAFPLSRAFFAAPPAVLKMVPSSFGVLLRRRVWQPVASETVEVLIRRGLSHFGEGRVSLIANATFLLDGLRDGSPRSAAEAAKALGVSAGRLRRARTWFWDSLLEERRGGSRLLGLDKAREGRRWLVAAFLAMLANRSGRLVVDPASDSSRDICRIRFLAECAGVAFRDVPELGVSVLGNRALELGLLGLDLLEPAGEGRLSAESVDPSRISLAFDRTEGGFTLEDVSCLALLMRDYRLSHLSRAERVLLSLRSLEKPSHYSQVARMYRTMFPGDDGDDRTVHSVLMRESARGPAGELVWAGARGVFALREWGYERPSSSLYNQAEEIVRQKHAETGRPVPLAVIASEMGTRRAVTNRATLVSVLRGNPSLTCVSGEFFVPASAGGVPSQDRLLIPGDPSPAAEDHSAIHSEDALDEALREFERAVGRPASTGNAAAGRSRSTP
jgi:hypothetical protein